MILVRLAGRRLAFVPLALFIVLTLSFAIVNLIPSDPVRQKLGPLASDADIDLEREALGLNQPIHERYWDYVTGVARGDLGRSYYSGRPVLDDIQDRLPNTLELIVLGVIAAACIGLTVGILGAAFRQRWPDKLSRLFVAIAQSVPDFFLALILIYVFYYKLALAPAPTGRLSLLDVPPERVTGGTILDSVLTGNWTTMRSALEHAVLPVLTLGVFYSAVFAKVARSAVGAALDSHQVEFARACGLPRRQVLLYALREARNPILTYGGILFAATLGAAAIVETIFAWGGLGQFAIERILELDLPEIQGFILVAGVFTLLVFLAVDLLVAVLDPRVAYG